jgi:hypothetical protein
MASIARSLSRGLTLGSAIAILLLSVLSVGSELRRFFDPCFSWGNSQVINHTTQQMRECHGRIGGTSETRLGALTRWVLIQGTASLGAILALKGSYRGPRRLILVGSALVFAVSVPLMLGNFGLITLICAASFLLSFLISSRAPLEAEEAE